MSNLRITNQKSRGLLWNRVQISPSYQQVINICKSNTQALPTIMTPTHSSTQIAHMITAFITTPDQTFAHLHSTNNKE